jgi:hypothetical protein
MFIPQAQALTPNQSISKAILEKINLQLSAGSGMFDDSWDYEKDVYEVLPIEIIPNPVAVGENYADFETHITVRANIRSFTTYGKDNTYWNAKANVIKYKWLDVYWADDWFWTRESKLNHDEYIVDYIDYDFLGKDFFHPQEFIKAKGYDGKFNLEVVMDDWAKAYGVTDQDEKVEIFIPEFYPTKITVVDADSNALYNYSDVFQDYGFQTELALMDFTRVEPATGTYGAMDSDIQQKLFAYISTGAIGVHKIDSKPASFTEISGGQNLGQEGREQVFRGEMDRVSPYNFQFSTRNIPRIEVYEQKIYRGKCEIRVDTQGAGAGFKDGTPIVYPADTPFRQVGWHIYENSHYQDLEIQFVARARLEADPVVLDRLLQLPIVTQGDAIWNIALTGNSDAYIFVDSGFFGNLWNKFLASGTIKWIVIGIILVGIGFLGYMTWKSPMIQRKIGARMREKELTGTNRKISNLKRNKGKLKEIFKDWKK